MKIFKPALLLLMATIIVVMAVATFVEQMHGSRYASDHVYATWWFFALWAVLAVMGTLAVCYRRLWRRAAVFSLHISLLVILVGSAVTWFTAHEGTMHIRKGERATHYLDQNGIRLLPFSVRLDSFRIVCYPGTQAPQDFVSHVTLDTDGNHASVVISMNNILRHQGYRFYQTSFDQDRQGTVLTVRYDPWGTPVTYLGYIMLGLSMLWVLLSRGGEFRRLLRRLSLVLLLMLPIGLHARKMPTINSERAKQMERMQVVYNDRVCPYSTLAHNFLLKIYGSTSYKGLSAVQVTYGWMARPGDWKHEPLIKVGDAKLRQQLGIQGRYASLVQLFDKGEYKLTDLPPTKATRELDEKVGLILMLTDGSLYSPLPVGTTPLSDCRVTAEIVYNTVPFTLWLFPVCLVLGLLALVPFRQKTVGRLLMAVLCVIFAFNLAGYFLRWYISGHIPLSNGFETMLLLSLLLQLLAMVLYRRFPLSLPFGLLLSGLTLLVAHLGQANPQITPLMPVLNSPLLSSHVFLVMTAYAMLSLVFMNSAYALVTRNRSQRAYDFSLLLLYPAAFCLAAGIFLGAVWANVSWGRYWSWDPKEVWALITWLVYAVAFHRQSIPLLQRPTAFHLYMVLAFLTLLMTYFGVNLFLGGMHAYS